MHKLCKTSHHKESYASLWKNPEICIGKTGVFWKQWQLKGVTVIGDLYENGIFMSYSELVKKIILHDKDIFGSICRSDTVLRTNLMQVTTLCMPILRYHVKLKLLQYVTN